MRFVYGLVGAIIGTLVGGAATVLILVGAFRDGLLAAMVGWIGLIIGAIPGIVISQLVWRRVQVLRTAGVSPRKADLLLVCWVVGPFLPIALGYIGLQWSLERARTPASDAAMIAHFEKHHADFEQLAQIDQASDAGRATSRPPGDYWNLLRSVSCSVEHSGPMPNGDAFGYWNYGDGLMFADEINKGYLYALKQPAPLLESLDNCSNDSDKDIDAYRHISGNWYLFYEYEPG